MNASELTLEYLKILTWPCVVAFILNRYRGVISSFLPRSKFKITFSGVTVETSLDAIQLSVEESLGGEQLTATQWKWLHNLRAKGRLPIKGEDTDALRPLRNAGLIRNYPPGWLASANEIEITTLGRLLSDAHDKSA